MLVIFPMLMCVISLTLHKMMIMTVYNLHSGIKLASPVYSCNCRPYYGYPIERTYTDAVMKFSFRFDPYQDESGGILVYEVQRKAMRSDHRPNIDTIYAKVIEEASKMMRLLITWKIKRFEKPKVNSTLVEYGNELVLNEDKLAQLYGKVNGISSDYSSSRWLMYDDTVLEVKHEVVDGKDLELKITTISKRSRIWNPMRPMWIDSERQVLSMIVIYFY
jgi:hypothetical protein